jgi:hypothetical protein
MLKPLNKGCMRLTLIRPLFVKSKKIPERVDSITNKITQILKSLDSPKVSLSMQTLEEKLLMFSNDIRLKDDVTVIEARYFG